jgi:RNA polymerase sigma factor (sigma-70 family)
MHWLVVKFPEGRNFLEILPLIWLNQPAMTLRIHSDSVCEEQNFQTTYRDYKTQLRNFIYYKCGDLDRADDITQESYIRLWENCKSLVMEKVRAFLYTVANRLLIDQARHDKIRLKFASENATGLNSEDPEYLAKHQEFKEGLEQAISALPETQREVFLMNRIDSLTYAQIAERLELSQKTVEKRMHLALQALKEQVKELNLYKF